MKIPDKAREAFMDRGTIYYFAGGKNYEENERSLKLPEWLIQLIEYEKSISKADGRRQIQAELQSLLGI